MGPIHTTVQHVWYNNVFIYDYSGTECRLAGFQRSAVIYFGFHRYNLTEPYSIKHSTTFRKHYLFINFFYYLCCIHYMARVTQNVLEPISLLSVHEPRYCFFWTLRTTGRGPVTFATHSAGISIKQKTILYASYVSFPPNLGDSDWYKTRALKNQRRSVFCVIRTL